MSFEEIKQGVMILSENQRREISTLLLKLRLQADPEYLRSLNENLADTDPTHWLTPEEFEQRLGQP